jgi:hypothetical protein
MQTTATLLQHLLHLEESQLQPLLEALPHTAADARQDLTDSEL